MFSRLVMLVVVLVLPATACSSAAARPSELDGMAFDEVGCTVVYRDVGPVLVGPLGPGSTAIFDPVDGFSLRIAQQSTGVLAEATEYSEAKGDNMLARGTKGWDDLPFDGEGVEVLRADVTDGHTSHGYVLRCWRGKG